MFPFSLVAHGIHLPLRLSTGMLPRAIHHRTICTTSNSQGYVIFTLEGPRLPNALDTYAEEAKRWMTRRIPTGWTYSYHAR